MILNWIGVKKWKQDGFQKQNLLHLKNDHQRLKDLNNLKSQTPVGPFTTCQQVQKLNKNSWILAKNFQ